MNRGGLSGAIGPEKSDDLSGFDLQAKVSKRPPLLASKEGSIALADAVELKHRGHSSILAAKRNAPGFSEGISREN